MSLPDRRIPSRQFRMSRSGMGVHGRSPSAANRRSLDRGKDPRPYAPRVFPGFALAMTSSSVSRHRVATRHPIGWARGRALARSSSLPRLDPVDRFYSGNYSDEVTYRSQDVLLPRYVLKAVEMGERQSSGTFEIRDELSSGQSATVKRSIDPSYPAPRTGA